MFALLRNVGMVQVVVVGILYENIIQLIFQQILYIKKLQEFDKRDLYKFTLDDQIKLASFVLNYEKSDNNYGVNEKLAKNLVNKWKNS